MSYSHSVINEVRNGAISITQRGFIHDRYKVNPAGQWGKILVMAMAFVDHLGPGLFSLKINDNKKRQLADIWCLVIGF